jgi:hypothetical protein
MKLMLRGESLDTLVESSGNDFFINEFRGIGQYGGWLGLEDVKLLLSRLRQVEKHFAYPNHEAVNILANLAGLWSQSPAEMMSKAYADAIEMLQTAINRNSALFVLLD